MTDTGDSTAGAPSADSTTTTTTDHTTTVKTFTQDELNDIISKEKAKLKASFDREQREQAKKDAEAQELARLDGEAKLRKEWEIKERELSERATKAEHDLAVSNARAMLSAKGYSDIADIAPYLIGKDADETELNVSRFDQMVQKLVSAQVAGNLNRGTPPDPSAGASPANADEVALRRAMGL